MTHDGHRVFEILGHGVEGAERLRAVDGFVEAVLGADEQLVDGRFDLRGLDLVEGDAKRNFKKRVHRKF